MPTKERAKPRYWVIQAPGEPWVWTPSKNCEGAETAPLEVGTHTIRGFQATVRIDRVGSAHDFAALLGTPELDARMEALATFPVAYLLIEGNLGDFASVLPRPGFSLLQGFASLTLDFPTVETVFAGGHGKTYLASLFARLMEGAKPPV